MTQGYTGKTGTFHATQTIAVPEYAPTMVGGVSPGKGTLFSPDSFLMQTSVHNSSGSFRAS